MGVPESGMPVAPSAGKADAGKRIVAALIDAIPAIIVGFVLGLIPFIGGLIGGLLAGAWWLVRDGLELEFADKRSPGKKIMKLRPVRLDGQPMTMEVSIKRNLPLAVYCVGYLFWVIPVLGWLVSLPIFAIGAIVSLIEAVLALTDPEGRRMGDKYAGTKVIEAGS
ncbi:MAG: RDD family protein [Thermoanaerobaculaceae bacterium]|jgi:uncharacterized RDD family membrane protein YckC|nr:RDD family protein [Thermoanaerobaculaceae bacterium]